MDRDLGHEIDELKAEIRQIRMLLGRPHLPVGTTGEGSHSSEVLTEESRKQLDQLRDQLVDFTASTGASGAIAYAGTFCSGDEQSTRQSMWSMVVSTDQLLALNNDRTVEKVLASISSGQKLAILLAVLKKPLTVNQLVEAVGANTTGQIYHHLKPLLAADILQEERGVYAVVPHRVQGIVLLLAGVNDLV